jgi:hypothetical protein
VSHQKIGGSKNFKKISNMGSLKTIYIGYHVLMKLLKQIMKFSSFLHGFILFLSFNFYFPNFREFNIKQWGLVVAS